MISWFERHWVVSWLVVVLLAGFIFYVSSLSFESSVVRSGGSWRSMVYHVGVFFVFGFFLMVALSRGRSRALVFVAVLLAVLYGVSDELHQSFVPGRAMTLADVFQDSVGVAFACVLYLISVEVRSLRGSSLPKSSV